MSTRPTISSSLPQWLSYLESIHPSTIDMGLARLQRVADNLQLDFSQQTVITVAGTNGKGTTCRFIEQALLSQSMQVGVYSSPHLVDYRERVRVQGDMLDAQAYVDALAIVDEARGDTSLTYFEFGTLAALVMFAQRQLDVVILEVGLGGRLDATNIIDPDLAVITSIGLDHQDWLGDTRELIAIEKAGIMRTQIPVVMGDLTPPATLSECVEKVGAKAIWANRDFSYTAEPDGWTWQGLGKTKAALPETRIPRQNVSTALAALSLLNKLPTDEQLKVLIEQTAMPGRMQILRGEPRVILDVAHNPQATSSLADWLSKYEETTLHFVVGMLADKAIGDTLSALTTKGGQWYLAGTSGPRGLSGADLATNIDSALAHQVFDSVVDAYQQAIQSASKHDTIVVFGSFLTVADVIAFEAQQSQE